MRTLAMPGSGTSLTTGATVSRSVVCMDDSFCFVPVMTYAAHPSGLLAIVNDSRGLYPQTAGAQMHYTPVVPDEGSTYATGEGPTNSRGSGLGLRPGDRRSVPAVAGEC